ncbi:outer membrane protein with beta-barrel domain [Aquimarina sp. MAR_2010_214]|uniref:porin family protein n=1 Tax=Aquimarina sp. MAR_2010_214 TaxID=1250026 RepID=UPI000C70DEB5|nr:porin family protein [Aquimarina sp. MAR_2010_214]PKV51664.1 outer membrane protein with beta-barrel domain [Aquimarina sp. MAR_2010_214]
MKKTIRLMLCTVLLGIITISAQEKQKGIEFGIKAGANLTEFRNASSNFKIGIMGGVFSQYRLSEKLAIRSEILYSAQGAKSKISSGKIKLNYINVLPAMIKFYPIKKLNLEAGPHVGYLLSGKGAGFVKSNFKKIDYGVALGIGYSLTDNLEVGIRYNLGLVDITKVSTTSFKNSVFQAGLAYKL